MGFYTKCLLLASVCQAVIVGAYELSIAPNVDRLFVTVGEPTDVVCNFQRNDSSMSVEWSPKDINIITYSDSTNSRAMEIKKFSVGDHDKTYSCEMKKADGSVVMSKNITLIGVKEDKISPMLVKVKNERLPQLNNLLECNITLSQDSLKISGPEWFWNTTSVSDLDELHYKVVDGGALDVVNAEPEDLGVYYARYQISHADHKKKPYSYSCKVEIRAEPTFSQESTGCKNVIEGKKIDLRCNVWGYPKPSITWYKDGKRVNVTQGSSKVMMTKVNGYENAHLMIDEADFEDSGDYKCEAFSSELNATASMEHCVGVKDKHAALWPFLAIVCEVLVLCAIIFVYEKKRNDRAKAAERETGADAMDTEVKSKVRNRRNQSS